MRYAERILKEVERINSINYFAAKYSRMDEMQCIAERLSDNSQLRLRKLVEYISMVREQRKPLNNQDGGVILNVDGGSGSGNWGHEGRPGKVGGSTGGGGVKYRLETPSGGFTSRAQAEAENKHRSTAATGGSGSAEGTKQSSKPPKVEHKSFEQMNREYPKTDKDLFVRMRKLQGHKYKDSWSENQDYKSFENPKGVRRKEIIKEYGSVDKWREKQLQDYMQEDKAQLEEKMDCFRSGTDLNKEYEKKVVKYMEREYAKNVPQYSDYDNDIKPSEFYQYQKESMKNMTTEDFAILQNSYYAGNEAYGSNYVKYAESKINGEELNWSQKRLEQIVDEHSVVMPGGRTVFRKTSEEEFKALTGKSLSEFDNNAPASERTATITKCTSFGTALQYNGFYSQNVIIEYTTKQGARAFFTSNTNELEGLFPPGTKISNITVKSGSNKKIPSIERKNRSTTDAGGLRKAEYKMDNSSKEGWYDYTYSGRGSHNANKKRMNIQKDPNYNGTINECVRVIVEVEG